MDTAADEMDVTPENEIMACGVVHQIVDLRQSVLTRIEKFKIAFDRKSDALKKFREFVYFETYINQFISALDDLINAIPDDDPDDLKNVEAKICRHQDIEAEVDSRGIELKCLEQLGLEMIRNSNSNSSAIGEKIHMMKSRWEILLFKLTDEMELLRAKQLYVDYIRNYEKISCWINKKNHHFSKRILFKSLESIENYIYEFKQIEKKIPRIEREVEDLKSISDFFIKDDLPQSYNVSQKKQNLVTIWGNLKEILVIKRVQLMEFIQLHKLCCRVNEFLAWIARKDAFFSQDETSNNLEELYIILKKHEGVEGLFDDMEVRLEELLKEYDSLGSISKIYTEGIVVPKLAIQQKWIELVEKAGERAIELNELAEMYKFFIEINCSIKTLSTMKSIVSTKNVQSTELYLQMLDVYKNVFLQIKEDQVEISKKGYELSNFEEREDEIVAKIHELDRSRKSFCNILELQKEKYEAVLDREIFRHKYAFALNWLKEKKSRLKLDDSQLNSLGNVQELLKKHEEFTQTFETEKEKIKNFLDAQIKLDMNDVRRMTNILNKKNELETKLHKIEELSAKRSQKLNDALKLQTFLCDCEDSDEWILEKLKVVSNDYYMDGSIIGGSIAFNNLFVNEFTDYSEVILKLIDREKEIAKEHHFGAELARERLKKVTEAWISLSIATQEKTQKLDEILDSQMFLLTTTKLELELSEYEERLGHQYVFHDGELPRLSRVEATLEALQREVQVVQRRIHNMCMTGYRLINQGHYNSEKILEKLRELSKRHLDLLSDIQDKRNTIGDARIAKEFYIDVDDQMTWMTKKLESLNQVDIDLASHDVSHLISKYRTQNLLLEVHEKEITDLQRMASKLIEREHYDSEEIFARTADLLNIRCLVNTVNEEFIQILEESNRIYEYFAEAELNEAIIKEKITFILNSDDGTNEDSSEALLKRHEVILEDLKAYGKKIEALREQAEICIQIPPDETDVFRKESAIAERNFGAQEPHGISMDTSKEGSSQVEGNDVQGFLSRISSESTISVSINPALKRQAELEKMYQDLMNLAETRRKNLVNTKRTFSLLRESTEMNSWIQEKELFVQREDVGDDVVQVEKLQKVFDDFQSDQAGRKIKLIEILIETEKLLPFLQRDLKEQLWTTTEDMKFRMKHLQELTKERDLQLRTAHELQKFYREIYEAEDWIQEKNEKLENDDCGHSLRTVRKLLRVHEGLERDMDALNKKIKELDGHSEYLKRKYPETSEKIQALQDDINEKLENLFSKVHLRKQNLLDSYDLQKFFADYNDLISWIDKTLTVVSSQERTNDMRSSEVLICDFERVILEIEQYEIRMNTIMKFGEMIIDYNENERSEIEYKLKLLKQSRELLEKRKNARMFVLQQDLEVNSFIADCQKIEDWLSTQELLLNTSGHGEKLIKMEAPISKKQKEIDKIEDSASKLTNLYNDDKEKILKKLDDVLSRWNNLKETHSTKCYQERETQTLQKFSLEAAEIECLIDDKLQQALQETYRSPTNLQAKLIKQKTLESEMKLQHKRIENVLDEGHRLLETEQSAILKMAVQKRLQNISYQWETLQQTIKETGEKLKEVSRQHDHIMTIKYLNFWMGEIETVLINQVVGKSLAAVQNLLVDHTRLEEDIQTHWENFEGLQKEVDTFKGDSAFEIFSIQEEHKGLAERFGRIRKLASKRKLRLDEKHIVLKHLETVAQNEAWIKEAATRIEKNVQPHKTRILNTFFSYKFKKSTSDSRTVEEIFREIDEMEEFTFDVALPTDGNVSQIENTQ